MSVATVWALSALFIFTTITAVYLLIFFLILAVVGLACAILFRSVNRFISKK